MPVTALKESVPFYLRRASGERLCPKCLEKSLIKHVKHSFRGLRDIKPGSTLCVFVPPGKVGEGASLNILLSIIERNYGSYVTSFFPSCVKELSGKRVIDLLNRDNLQISFYEGGHYIPSLFDLINHSTREGIKNCRNIGIKLPTLLPFTLTDIIEAFLEFMIFQGNNEGLKVFNDLINNSIVLLPFKEVTRSDVLAYIYSKELMKLLNSCPFVAGKGVRMVSDSIAELEIKHSELIYSTLKSLKYLIKVKG